MTDEPMPAALAAILAEDGWERLAHNWGWRYDVFAGTGDRPAVFVLVDNMAGYPVRLMAERYPDGDIELTTEQVADAADLMRRIEAALTQDGTT